MDAPAEAEVSPLAQIPMRLCIWLRGSSEAIVLKTNGATVEQVVRLLEDQKTSQISISNDRGEQPFMFSAPRRNIGGIFAEIAEATNGWCVLEPTVAQAVTRLLREASFMTETRRAAAVEIADAVERGGV